MGRKCRREQTGSAGTPLSVKICCSDTHLHQAGGGSTALRFLLSPTLKNVENVAGVRLLFMPRPQHLHIYVIRVVHKWNCSDFPRGVSKIYLEMLIFETVWEAFLSNVSALSPKRQTVSSMRQSGKSSAVYMSPGVSVGFWFWSAALWSLTALKN